MAKIKDSLISQGMKLIPVSELSISHDKEKTCGYDLTVEDNYTFSTHDGVYVQDTMSVFVPVSEEAQEEAKRKMVTPFNMSGLLSMNFDITKEMLTGIYTATYEEDPGTTFKSIQSATDLDLLKYKLRNKIEIRYKGEVQRTTVGRIKVNECLPQWYPFINDPIDKKYLNKILKTILSKNKLEFVSTVDKLKEFGFYVNTVYPRSYGLDMMDLNPKLLKLKEEMSKETDFTKISQIEKEMEKELVAHLKVNAPDLYEQIQSGASKGTNQIRQVMVAKGLIADGDGNIINGISKSMNDGYSPKEYFNAAYGSRTGVISRALLTASGGYSARKTIFVCGNVELNTNMRDCGTTKGLVLRLTPDLYKKLPGRYVIENGEPAPIDASMIGKIITLRSPIFCKSEKICKICYGDLYKQINSRNIGICAAQSMNLSEKIMRSTVGLCFTQGQYIAMEDMWNKIDSPIIKDGELETKEFISTVAGKDGDVKTYCMQKHPPKAKMLFISTKSGHCYICQEDHPVWVKKTRFHPKYDNKTCRIIGDEFYSTTGSGRSKPFEVDDKETVVILAKDLQKYDGLWIDNRSARFNENSVVPDIDPYFVGTFVGDGSWNPNQPKRFTITKRPGKFRDAIINRGFSYFKKEGIKDVYFSDPSCKLKQCVIGCHSYEKHLNSDFINYDKEWLRSFLAGLIDTDGSVFNGPDGKHATICRIYTSSYNLMFQLKMICLKLGYHMNPLIVPYKKDRVYGNGAIPKRPHFQCDILFYKNSIPPKDCIKINDIGGVIPIVKYRKDDVPTRGFDLISTIKEIDLWEYPVFDIKTETKEFLINGMQTHNSFHLGGAVDLKTVNILDLCMDTVDPSLESGIRKNFIQKENILYNQSDFLMVQLDKTLYKDSPYEVTSDGNYILPVGYFTFMLKDINLPINIEMETTLFKSDNYEEDNTHIRFVYSTGDPIIQVLPKPKEYAKLASVLDKLIGGKSPWTDPTNLYLKFVKQLYMLEESYDSVHMEVLISNILRNSKNPKRPARLVEPYDATLFSVKKLPSIISWPLGIAFENFGSAVTYGMISDRSPSSPIEKVMFGESLIEGK